MVTNPRHRQLLPLFLGQPIAMVILALIVGSMLTGMWAVAQACIEQWRAHGYDAFLPSTAVWQSFFVFGFGLALFNIACDSVEVDMNIAANALEANEYVETPQLTRMRERLTPYTWLLGIAAAFAVAVAIRLMLSGTFVHGYHEHYLFGLVEGALLFTFIALPLLRSHQRTMKYMFRNPKMPGPNEVR